MAYVDKSRSVYIFNLNNVFVEINNKKMFNLCKNSKQLLHKTKSCDILFNTVN